MNSLYGAANVVLKEQIYTKDFLLKFLDSREEKLLTFALKRWGFGNSKKIKLDSLTDDSKIYRLEVEEVK